MFEQLIFVNCRCAKAFTELCSPLNVAYLIVGQLVLLIFLDYERKPLQIHSPYHQWLAVHPVFSPFTSISTSLDRLYHWQMDVFTHVVLPKSLRNLFCIWTTDFDSWCHSTGLAFCIWDGIFCNTVSEPLVARLGSPNCGVSNLDHITYLILERRHHDVLRNVI